MGPGSSQSAGRIDFVVWPGLADGVEYEADSDFGDVPQTTDEADAGLAVHAPPHSGGRLDDFKTGAMQKQDHFGLGIVFGIPVCESADDFFVGGSESAGA